MLRYSIWTQDKDKHAVNTQEELFYILLSDSVVESNYHLFFVY